MSLRPRRVVQCVLVAALLVGVAAAPVLAQGGGRIVGMVVDEEGNPMVGVLVTAENPAATQLAFETTTGDDGRYAILGMVSGQWNFRAEIEGYHPNEGQARITQGPNLEANFTLHRIRHPLEIALGDAALEGLDPVAIEQELEQADAAFNVQQWDQAIAGYNSLLAKLPQLTNLHLQIGNALQQKADYQGSIAAFERALVDDPENETAKTGIARSKLAMGDFDAASEELAAAVSGLNAAREDLYNLGELEFANGAVDAAAEWYEKATMVDPTWVKPLFKLALVALNKGDTETAKKYFQQVVDVDPDSEEGVQSQATLAALP